MNNYSERMKDFNRGIDEQIQELLEIRPLFAKYHIFSSDLVGKVNNELLISIDKEINSLLMSKH